MKSLLAWVVVLLLQGALLTGAQEDDDCPVDFVEHPQDMTANLGDTNIRLHCSVNDGGFFNWDHYLLNGTRWTIGDNALQEPRGFTIDTSNGDLLILVVQSFHAGLYSCHANRGNCWKDSNNATFNVNGRPEISLPSQSYSVDTLQTLNITGLITGFPLPRDAQLLNETSGEVITNERFNISLVDMTLTIMVKGVQVSDRGTYRVNASNSLGDGSQVFQIETKGPDPPKVMVQSAKISEYNTAVSVTCSVQATAGADDARLTMVWIDPQGREVNSSSDRTELTLSIASLQSAHTGTYRCSANNTRGVNSNNTTIYGPLSPIRATVIPAGSNSGSFRIMWDRHPAFTTFTITYRIYVYREGTDEVVIIAQVNGTETILEGLSAGRYEVRVVANAEGVTGMAGNTSTFAVEDTVVSDNTQIIAAAGGAGAGVLVLIVIGGAIGIFFLCFYYPHRRKLQSQQQTWGKDDDDGEVVNNYTTLTLHPSIELPPSPESVMISSIFSTEIDPKWEFPRENIQLSEVLHEGQFTVLYKGVAKGIREKPMDIAVKAVKDDATEDDVKLLIAEMEQLSGLGQHPNIVSLIRVCTVGKPLYMVMEYMCHGDLLGFLRCSRGHQSMFTISPGIHNQPPCLSLSSRDIITIATKIANGMRYLTDRKIVHRALCARNVLVGTSMDIKIYNVGAFDVDSRELMKWMAPETLFDSTTTTCSDVWSFGVTLWELVTVGGSPYAEILPEDLYTQLHSGMRMPKPPHCAQEVYDIMSQCWQKNPTDRPHFAVIHEKLNGLASSKMSFLDLRNYNGMEYSQFEDYPQLSTAL